MSPLVAPQGGGSTSSSGAAPKLPFLGFAAGVAMLAIAWGTRLKPVVRWLITVTAFVVILSHSTTVLSQFKGALKQL
jgi:hypothetical protein